MKYIAVISIVLSSQCFGMGGADYEPLLDVLSGSEVWDKLDEFNRVDREISIAKKDVANFLQICRSLNSLDRKIVDLDSQSIKTAMRERGVPADKILETYKKNWGLQGDAQHSSHLNYERAALFYCASYGLFRDTRLILKNTNFFEVVKQETSQETCLDGLFKNFCRDTSEGKVLVDKLLDIARERLNNIKKLDTTKEISIKYADIRENVHTYRTNCLHGELLVTYLNYISQLNKKLDGFLPIPAIKLIIAGYVLDNNDDIGPVGECDCCVIL